MLPVRDFRRAQQIVDDLHAQGREDWARTIEALLDFAVASLAGQRPTGQAEFLTTGQAARALGVSIQTIENWVASGKLDGTRLGGRTVIQRSALLAYLEELVNQRGESIAEQDEARSAVEAETARQQRQYVLAGLPEDKVTRLDALHQKVEDGKRLVRDERSEMARLERELTVLASRQMRRWFEQRQFTR